MFYAVLLMKWKIYIVVKQKKGSWPLDLLEKSVSFIKRILKQKLNWYISKPKLLLFADIIKNELSIQVFEKKQTPKEKLCDGDSWNLWFKQGKNIEAKKKDKNLPAKLANQLIEKYSQRKQIIPSNQTSFAEEMKSHLTEK